MSKEEYASSLFVLMNKLKNTKRKGWYDKNIERYRVESVADHIYGCQMLAYAMYSEFKYDIDINKVILMLAVHEIGETIIGDITPEDMPSKEKSELETKAVEELLEMIPNSKLIKELFYEFEAKETPEAKFAYQIDKSECDLQARLYEQEGCFLKGYQKFDFSRNWIGFDRGRIPFDNNFDSLLQYVTDNDMQITEHSDNAISNVISFYTLANSLKNVQRTGEKIWNIQQEHFGSVAEHIYSVQMLAIILHLVYKTEVDITKVVNLLSIHELGEIKFGDKDALTKTDSDRNKELSDAIATLSILTKGKMLIDMLKEFNDSSTRESIYAKYCDKLAPDIISKIYDQQNLIDLNNQDNNPLMNVPIVKKYLDMKKSFSTMWIMYGQEVYKYQEPFISVSNYVLNNNLEETYTSQIQKKLVKQR